MSSLVCPKCGLLDRVQSVRAVYESQTSRYSGQTRSFNRGTYYSSGSASSGLAAAVAPPAPPAVPRAKGGCALAAVIALAVAASVLVLPMLGEGKPGAGQKALTFWAVTGGPFAVAAVAMIISRIQTGRRNRQAVRSYTLAYPALSTAWNAAALCHRCHVAFLPKDALKLGAFTGRPVPIPQFQQMIASVALELRSR